MSSSVFSDTKMLGEADDLYVGRSSKFIGEEIFQNALYKSRNSN
jgi:hypothetical protein